METSLYHSREWRNLRARALDRDGHRCTIGRFLGTACAGPLHVDHLIPVTDGGPALPSLDGVTTVCQRHHPTRHAVRRAIIERRPSRRRCRHYHPYPQGREACEARLNTAV
jgi:hypothetical protein